MPRKLRWEKFAPAQVRTVSISHVPPQTGEPKRRGRPRTRKVDEVENADGGNVPAQGLEEVFSRKAQKRSTVVFFPEETVPTPELFGDAGPTIQSVETVEKPWPSRATFAGRAKPKEEEGATTFDNRRSKFYGSVPSHLWRDGLEREFWKLCVSSDSMEKAVEEFLQKHAPEAKPKSNQGAKGRGRGNGRGRGRVLPKEPGRHRARGKAAALKQ